MRGPRSVILLQMAANIAGAVMVISALHILYINVTLLPRPIRPAMWRRVALVGMAVFYGFFVHLWMMGGVLPDREKGFLFVLLRAMGLGGG